MDFNSSSGEDSSEWESDFINKYTTKSVVQGYSPRIEDFQQNDVSLRFNSENMKVEESFCTKENLESRLLYLNQEMGTLGLPSILSKKTNSESKEMITNFDPVQMINCTHELVKMQQQSMRRRSDLEERQMRSESDYEALFQNQTRLKDDLESSKREECLLRLRETQLQEKVKKLQLELKNEKEEVKKMKSDQQHKYKQFIHEGKRKEKEMLRLKDRVHQLLTDNKSEKSKGIIISNTLTRSDGRRGTWKGVNRDGDDMYKTVIARYEERHKELISENTHLREYLAQLLNDYVNMLKEQYWTLEEGETDTKLEDIKPDLHKGHFSMPFHLVKEDIHSNFQVAFQVLRERLEQGSSKGSTPPNRSPQSEEEKEQLKMQLENCREVIYKQDELLQDLQEKMLQLSSESQEQLSPRDVEQLKERVKTISQEKENLRLNRKKYTDLVVKLANEREAFEKEKIEFYKNCFSTPMLAAATSRESNNAREKGTGGRRVLPTLTSSTPVFSPAPRDTNNNSKNRRFSAQTPSTAELYRFMSMMAEKTDLEESGVDKLYDEDPDANYLRRRKSSSARNRSGSYDTEKTTPVNHGHFESPISHRSKRVSEHAEKVKQAIENHHRSIEEMSPRMNTSDGLKSEV